LDAQLDAQFEQQDRALEKRFLQVKKAVDDAYQGLTKKITVNWHADVALPQSQSWTTYDDAFTSRATFDFANGVYKVETIVGQDVAQSLLMLKAFASKIAQSNQTELANIDVFRQALQNELQQAHVLQVDLVTPMPAAPPYIDVNVILTDDTSVIINQLALDSIVATEEGVESTTQSALEDMPLTEVQADLVATVAPTDLHITKPKNNKVSLKIEEKQAVKRLVLSIPFINSYQKVLLESKLDFVKELANRYQLDVSLILAVIETESSFNPMATSPIPAFGLMQLVPNTAGIDAYEYLYGQREVVSPEYLFDQNNNLLLGITYIHILSSRYLRGIQNQQSKLYCMLASYNTGVGNLARTFINKKSLGLAVTKINSLDAEQTYTYLMENLPAEETKNYLRKILARKKQYASFD
jgi:membrane-bound lytic murein transglycosylase C